MDAEPPDLGLVLTGGGARAAYQVGVLKGIAQLLRRGSGCPFPIITGTSAGAVSAVALAADPAHFGQAVYAIERVWREFRVHHVFKADGLSMLKSALHWALAVLTGGWLVHPPRSMFDIAPLRELLHAKLDFDGIPRGLYKGHLDAVGICATSYAHADSMTFYASQSVIDPWKRAFHEGARVQLSLDHVMASLALPFLFRPILVNDQYYGDGAMRQTSPLSPAIHLGANRLLVIGVGDVRATALTTLDSATEPSFGHMFGFMLDSLFTDQLHADLEHIKIYNQRPGARHIETLVVTPSEDLSEIARRHRHELPAPLRALLRTLGANNSAGMQLLSYLLFEKGYTRELIALGQKDAQARAAEIRQFLALEFAPRYRAPSESQAAPSQSQPA